MHGGTSFRHPPLAADHLDRPHRQAALGDLALESGEVIHDCVQSYVTHGELNAAGDNTVLVCTSISGTHHRLDFLIGPGRALDPARHFIVVADALGNGLSTSPSNSVRQPGMHFPRFTLRDMVQAQHRLLTDHLGVARLASVVGASMGGMQALQWGVSHPGFMRTLVAMTPMARTHPWAAMVTATARACLMADPAWTGDGFDREPIRGRRAFTGVMQVLATRSPESLPAGADVARAAEWFDALVAQQAQGGPDPHDYLYQSWAYDAHDVGTTPGRAGGTAGALATITARSLLLAPAVDWFNPAITAREAAAAMPDARCIEIPSAQGHFAATSGRPEDAAFLNATIRAFLDAA